MTPERQNEIWAMLDSQCQNIAKDVYIRGNAKVAWAIEQFFGKHNLTSQAEDNAKAKDFPILSDSLQASVDWESYRLDLAKVIAVAMIQSTQSCYPNEVAALANEIVERLKETEE